MRAPAAEEFGPLGTPEFEADSRVVVGAGITVVLPLRSSVSKVASTLAALS